MTNALLTSSARAAEYENVTRDIFEQVIKPQNKPAVLRGLAKDWPITQLAKTGLAPVRDYIGRVSLQKDVEVIDLPPEHNGRVFYTDDLKGFNFERRKMTLTALLEELSGLPGSSKCKTLYAGAVNIPAHLPSFAAEHTVPILPAETEKLESVWIGNRSRIPPHWDLPQNIACVVAGQRQFTLFPIQQISNLYIGPLDFTIAGQPCSLVDLHAPDLERFPRFKEAAQHAVLAELEPGDAIYIPSMWIHHVEALSDFGMLVNTWWRDGAEWLITPTLTLMHALLSLRDLPETERESWKTVFDHFIFNADETTLDHLPENARGMLSQMTPELNRWLRATLSKSLSR